MTGRPPGGSTGMLGVTISPSDPALDTTLRVTTSGAPPGALVTLTGSQLDTHGRTWRASATFVADDAGVVDTTSDAPLTGSYEGVDAMGLVWSMAREDLPPRGMRQPPLAPVTLEVSAAIADGPVTTMSIDRARLPDDVARVPVDVPGVAGVLFHPSGDGPWPGVLLLGGAEGGLHELDAALLAAHGFCVLALAYFGVPGTAAVLVDVPLEVFGVAIEFLLAQPEVRADRVGIVGGSRGGEAALLIGATLPHVATVVSTVGSGVITAGIPPGAALLDILGIDVGSWTWRGRRLPYLPYHVGDDLIEQVAAGGSVELARAFRPDLASRPDLAAATIPVERIQGPVLLLSAEDDRSWPSVDLSEVAAERLRRLRHPYPFEHIRYRGAGHVIAPSPYGPTESIIPGPGVRFLMGGTVADTSAARADAWTRTIAWLAEHLPT